MRLEMRLFKSRQENDAPSVTRALLEDEDDQDEADEHLLAPSEDGESDAFLDSDSENELDVAGEEDCPEEKAGFLSKVLFLWVSDLLLLGRKRILEFEDLWSVAKKDRASTVGAAFENTLRGRCRNVKKKKQRKDSVKFSLFGSICRQYGGWFFRTGLLKLVHDIIQFTIPMILRYLLDSIENSPGVRDKKSMLLAVLLYVASVSQTLVVNTYFNSVFRLSMHLKTGLTSSIYRKALKMNMSSRKEIGSSNITNLMSNDAQKIGDMPTYLHVMWSGPLQIIVTSILLSFIIGIIPTVCAFVTMCVLIPVAGFAGKTLNSMRKDMMTMTDERIKCAAEVVNGIKTIKLYAWEDPYEERVLELRKREMRRIKSFVFASIANMFMFSANPVIVAVIVFSVYTYVGGQVSADIAFPTLALLNQLRFPLLMVPRQLVNIVQCRVALKRIKSFMIAEEVVSPPPAIGLGGYTPLGTVKVEKASFTWDNGSSYSRPTLSNISLNIAPGQFCIVVGRVGSGKSSLLHALLGEMACVSGTSSVVGSISYSAQDTWIRNSSVKENIIFGSEYDEERYQKVLECCCLNPDLAALPAGDMTEIGEKGVNLSGGQKHRVSLARSVYAMTDVVLLDDPISAVDAHVGQKIVDDCIFGLMSDRTRILVTHQTQHAMRADVIVLMENGEIKDIGSYRELISRSSENLNLLVSSAARKLSSNNLLSLAKDDNKDSKSRVSSFISNTHSPPKAKPSKKESATAVKEVVSEKDELRDSSITNNFNKILKKEAEQTSSKIVSIEDRARGTVARHVYKRYIREWSSVAYLVPAIVATLCICTQTSSTGRDFVLSMWSDSVSQNSFYVKLYAIIAFTGVLFQGLQALTMAAGTLRAAEFIHKSLLNRIMRLPMSFFDSNPTGRIVNRFTKDTEDIDQLLPTTWNGVIGMSAQFVFSLLSICIIRPLVLICVVPVLWIFKTIQNIYMASSREIARFVSISRSPIFAHFGESVSGLTTIRAFSFQKYSLKESLSLLDNNNRAFWPSTACNRWLGVRLEILGETITFIAAMSSCLAASSSAGLSGFAISTALNLTGMLNWLVRQLTLIENQMNSVERVLHYANQETEAATIIEGKRPPQVWPTDGCIRVNNLWLRYRDDLDPVLRGISFETNAAEKLGIVGRTGCGKSTLMLALFRIVEPLEGSIKIDGVECLSIGLFDLRSRLALVPQDPVLFSGTIRSNIDPFSMNKNDSALWTALDRSGIGPYVRSLPGHLDAKIEESGQNMSVGQRQMLCIARAWLAIVLPMDCRSLAYRHVNVMSIVYIANLQALFG